VELGHRRLIATDQHQFIPDYAAPVGVVEVDQSVPLTDRLLGRHGAGSIVSLSFDEGFTRTEDGELIRLDADAEWTKVPLPAPDATSVLVPMHGATGFCRIFRVE